MNYELAKQLKDAGFPQKGIFNGVDGWIVIDGTLNGTDIVNKPDEPTLSEIIEACGEEFDAIFGPYSSLNNHEGVHLRDWRADSVGAYSTTGSTHEEAVARLWLALNKPAG